MIEQSGKKRRNCTNTGTPVFVDKLNNILQSPQFESIVSWSNDGKSFVIKNVSAFIEQVLPAFFKHSNLSSFIRQLNMYNFSKTRSAEGEHAYSNEFFQREHPQLYNQIKRRVANDPQPEGQLALKDQPKPSRGYAKELQEIASKQREMEVVCMKLFRQNQNLIAQNGKMWRKITRRLEKKDRRVEKLLYFFLMRNNQALLENGIEPPNLRNNLVMYDSENDADSSDQDSFGADSEVDEHETLKAQKVNPSIMNLMSLLNKKSSKKLLRMLLEENKNGAGVKKKRPNYTIVDQDNSAALVAPSPQLPLPKSIENLCIKQHGQSRGSSPKVPMEAQHQHQQPLLHLQANSQAAPDPNPQPDISDVNMYLNTDDHHQDEWFKLQEP